MANRKKLPVDVRRLVLHESGYKCGNPVCRHIITLDVHHIVPVEDRGGDTPENLLPLCPNCHSLHHAGTIPDASIRAWKHLLLALNEGFDRRTVEILFALRRLRNLYVTGDGVLSCGALIASELITVREGQHDVAEGEYKWDFGGAPLYTISLSDRGRRFVEGWESGDQIAAIALDGL